MSLTYVTAFLNVYNTPTPDTLIGHIQFQPFYQLAETGVQICIAVHPTYEPLFREISKKFPNVYLLKSLDTKDTWIFNCCSKFNELSGSTYTLPTNRNPEKDTEAFLQYQHCKHEILELAMEKNPFNSNNFAWVDFNITQLFRNAEKSKKQLQAIGNCSPKMPFFAIPGCWEKWDMKRHAHHLDNIHWRFCGCFFVADHESMRRFCKLYRDFFPRFLKETKKLVWDVNFWAWLEHNSEWTPTWFIADHNDSCLQIPNEFICSPLEKKYAVSYDYKEIRNYFPSSASYLFYKGKHWLNTRYVSYYLTDQCYYLYPDGTGVIKNKNVLSQLKDHGGVLVPMDYVEMDESSCGLQNAREHRFSRGLEDMRLYEFGGKVRFVATTVGYSQCSRARIVVGDYNMDTFTYSNCHVITPPNPDSWCEKNWIPITYEGEEAFIYRWSPMEIGKIVDKPDGSKHLQIIKSHDIQEPWFHKVRGSTTFTKTEEGLLGVVHFSDEGSPRHYYHVVILLDPVTLKPIRYSKPFYFQKIGVEFCIGFTVIEGDYVFWLSRMDRDPLMVRGTFCESS
jgi:hypothetical protein